jgi:hypothetical protein
MPYVYRKASDAREGDPLLAALPLQQQIPQSQPGLTRIQPPSHQQQGSLQYPERIMKKIQTAQQYDCQYIPTSEDIKEIEFEKYKQVFKDTLVHDIIFLRRIKELPSGKEWLVYRYEDTITDDSNTTKTHGYYAGFDTQQMPNLKRNALREIIDVIFEREKIIYTIPFSKEAVDTAIAKADNIPSDYAVCYGSTFGPDPWKGSELTIWNLNDFTTYPFEILEEANKTGFTRKDGTGIPDMLDGYKEHDAQIREGVKNMNVQKAERDLQKARSYQAQQNQQKKG